MPENCTGNDRSRVAFLEDGLPWTRDERSRAGTLLSNVDELGETLRVARIRKGMSQQEVALAAGVGRRFVGKLEGGKVTAEIGRVFVVCRVVGLAIIAVPR